MDLRGIQGVELGGWMKYCGLFLRAMDEEAARRPINHFLSSEILAVCELPF